MTILKLEKCESSKRMNRGYFRESKKKKTRTITLHCFDRDYSSNIHIIQNYSTFVSGECEKRCQMARGYVR